MLEKPTHRTNPTFLPGEALDAIATYKRYHLIPPNRKRLYNYGRGGAFVSCRALPGGTIESSSPLNNIVQCTIVTAAVAAAFVLRRL